MRISDWSSDVCSSDLGQMLDGLFAITRDFDMQTQPHLLLLQKTMVMVEGVATMLNPKINMWDVSGPFVSAWIRDELGPEAALADGIREQGKTLALIPDIIRRLDAQLPRKGAAPPAPPLPRSEEHTSELQSLMRISYAVFCLKKKKFQH